MEIGQILFAPPIAFLIYLALAALLSGLGRLLAGPTESTPAQTSIYASGEAPPTGMAVPGYRPFFIVALFFAVLHLGALVLASGGVTPLAAAYLVGLALVLLALLLG